MTTSGITNINAKLIHQHPDNPRKDLGDLTELSESIKKKGIMQNLTVIPGYWDEKRTHHEEGYTLIIGHRRFAAGKMAGVTMYPCRIVEDMSYKDQVGTMLEENMQRIDLTVLEQAEGFQMMLNLGDTEEQIAEKTGFSRTTVRRRLEIAKLDRDLVKEKTDEDGVYQLNLKDLAELSRIEDVETRNRILKDAADSRQIKWKVEAEIKNKEREKNKKIIVELLEEAGIKKATKEIEKKKYTAELKDVKTFSLDKEPPKRINIRGKELYYLDGWNGIDVVEKLPKSEKVETEWDRQRKKTKQLKALQKKMNERKKEFIRTIADGKVSLEQAKDIYHYLGRIREIKAESNNRILKGAELENVLKSIGIDPELAAEKTKDCDAAEIDADNTVSTKTFEIGLSDAHVSVSADRTDLVTLEVINGEKYILVKADGDINANGIILENREGEKDEEEDD